MHETSPTDDFPHGSSLDLSPSDSSGGTYMWDEEGMEALGGSGHPCGSFCSDLNSMVSNDDRLKQLREKREITHQHIALFHKHFLKLVDY